jgi:hypothetical protein
MRWALAVLVGWVALLAIAYGIEGQLLRWTGPLFSASWMATAHLAFDCLTLAAAGWAAGRFNRDHAMLTVGLFALTLCCWDFEGALALNIPWLLRLIRNSFQDSRYVDSLLANVETQVLLFGCLMMGGALSRPRERPVSIVASKKMLE